MILHGREKIPETFRGAIQEALEKGLLKEGGQITKVADYSSLLQHECRRQDVKRTLSR